MIKDVLQIWRTYHQNNKEPYVPTPRVDRQEVELSQEVSKEDIAHQELITPKSVAGPFELGRSPSELKSTEPEKVTPRQGIDTSIDADKAAQEIQLATPLAKV